MRMTPIDVLLVEDNRADVDLTRETLAAGRLRIALSVVSDGEEAIRFLRRLDQYALVPRPDLILLDLNLPKMDGREVLLEIKGDASLRRIPVVVLTSSDAEVDIIRSYDFGANCYVTKPSGLQAFQQIVRTLEDFWFTVVKLPPGQDGGLATAGARR